MNSLRTAVAEYLTLRRGLGFKLKLAGRQLLNFVAFMEQQRAESITRELALAWAMQPTKAQPAQWALRLGAVRTFARYWSATDPRTEDVPLGLLPHRYRRKSPYSYSDAEIMRLLKAARELPSATGLRAKTYSTLLGLLVVTGLRISEVVALERVDVDFPGAMLTIRRTKFGKTRLIPVHPSTRRVLARYARSRDRVHPVATTGAFFVGEAGARLSLDTVRWTFVRLSRQIGLRGPDDHHGPRLHDLRHRWAVDTLLRWYRAGVDIERRLPELSTYLGHTHVADTYWYVTAVPELMHLAATRLERGDRSP